MGGPMAEAVREQLFLLVPPPQSRVQTGRACRATAVAVTVATTRPRRLLQSVSLPLSRNVFPEVLIGRTESEREARQRLRHDTWYTLSFKPFRHVSTSMYLRKVCSQVHFGTYNTDPRLIERLCQQYKDKCIIVSFCHKVLVAR